MSHWLTSGLTTIFSRPHRIPIDFHAWGYMKKLVYEQPVNTPDEVVRRKSDTTGQVNLNSCSWYSYKVDVSLCWDVCATWR